MKAKNSTDFRQLLEQGPIPMWIVAGPHLAFIFANEAASRLYGYTQEEFLQMVVTDICCVEEKSAGSYDQADELIGTFAVGPARHKTKDGSFTQVYVYIQPAKFEGREVLLCYILHRSRALAAEQPNALLEDALLGHRIEINQVLSSMDEAIWTRTADEYKLIFANKAYYSLFGNGPADARDDLSYFLNNVYPPDREILLEVMGQAKTSGYAEAVYRQLQQDGILHELKLVATLERGQQGKPDMITGITTDITYEKELFDAVRNSEQKLLATINNTRDLIWSVDRDLKIIFCNTAYQDYFLKRSGVALDEGDYVLGHWHPEGFIAKRKLDYERALSGESFVTIVEECFNGFLQYSEISSSPIVDHTGKVTGVNCIARDITSQRRQLICIREQNEKLKDLALARTNKIRRQMNGLLESVTRRQESQEPADQFATAIDQLNEVSENLNTVIREIKSITKNIDQVYPEAQHIITRL